MQVCLFCGSANGSDARVCHSCSQPLGGEEEQAPETPENSNVAVLTECPNCGAEIGPEDESCQNCNHTLFSSDPLDKPCPKTHDHDITTRYDDFASRVQMVLDGRMNREQFGTWLGTIQQMLISQRDRYVEMIRTSGYYEFSTEEVDMGMTGILDFEEAMDIMGLYSRDEADVSVLQTALEKMWEGNQKCNEAMRINREFRKQLEDDWGYM